MDGSVVFATWRQRAPHIKKAKSLPWQHALEPQSVPILYNGTPLSPLKIAPSHGGIWTPSNTCFLGPTRVHNPNGISISSAIFAGLTSVTDRQTDRQTTLLGR